MQTEAQVRDAFRTFLDDNWDPDSTLGQWWECLGLSGWAMPTWPEEWYGKGLGGDLLVVVNEERAKVGAPGPPAGLSTMLAGPTLIAHASDDVKRRYLGPIVTGQHAWCQLFSEPGAGSDLASLQCRAIRDGDEWVVSGQKVWTSGAQTADVGMLVARTDVDLPKHRGLTYFVIHMDQPGVEVRPLREMTGRALFNEVFFDEARVSNDDVVGDLNGGWAVALTTLANERVGLGGGISGASQLPPGRKAGFLDRRVGDLQRDMEESTRGAANAMRARSHRALISLAQEQGRADDPIVRQQLAQLHIMNEVGRFNALRSKAAVEQGSRPGPEASTGKLNVSRISRLSRDAGLAILGPYGMLAGADAPRDGAIQEMATFSPATSIYGGSDEVQKNIIGERVLGLPKEPSVDKDVPFKDLKVGTQRPTD